MDLDLLLPNRVVHIWGHCCVQPAFQHPAHDNIPVRYCAPWLQKARRHAHLCGCVQEALSRSAHGLGRDVLRPHLPDHWPDGPSVGSVHFNLESADIIHQRWDLVLVPFAVYDDCGEVHLSGDLRLQNIAQTVLRQPRHLLHVPDLHNSNRLPCEYFRMISN